MSGHVVVGIDGSARGLPAVGWACEAAARRGAALRVIHVAAPWAVREPANPKVARVHRWARETCRQVVDDGVAAARQHGLNVEPTGEVRYGEPAQELLAEGAGAALLVIASRGTGGFSGLLLGSVALHVTAHATCPVVVVRTDEPEGAGNGYGEIVAGVDGSAESQAAARFAVTEAALRGARLRVLRARTGLASAIPGATRLAGPRADDPSGRDDEQTLDELVAELRELRPGVEIVREVVQGRPAGVLTAVSSGADLVVVGSRGRSALKGLVLGSVSHAVLHHARCPVAVVRSADL